MEAWRTGAACWRSDLDSLRTSGPEGVEIARSEAGGAGERPGRGGARGRGRPA